MSSEEKIEQLRKREKLLFKIRRAKYFIAKPFFGKAAPVFLLLIILIFGLFFRVYPAMLPIIDKGVDDNIDQALYMQFLDKAHKNYPMLSLADKEQFARKEVEDFKKNSQEYKEERERRITKLKNALTKDGFLYPARIDPYHHLDHTLNVLDHGYRGSTMINGTKYDMRVLAPVGKERDTESLLPHFAALFHKTLNLFFDLTILQTFVLIPILISLGILTLFFLIGRKLMGNAGGFFVGFFAALDPWGVSREFVGFTDTDVFNVFFYLFILYLFMIMVGWYFKEKKVFNIKIFLWLLAFCFCIGLFAFTWSGWWNIVLILLSSLVVFMGYIWIRYRTYKHLLFKKAAFLLGSIYVGAGIFTIPLIEFHNFIKIIPVHYIREFFFGATFSQAGEKSHLLPSVYAFIGELKSLSVVEIFDMFGLFYLLVFIAGIGCLGYVAYSSMKQNKPEPKADQQPHDFPSTEEIPVLFFIIFLAFSAMTTAMILTGVRFFVYFSIPYSIISGFFFAFIFVKSSTKIASLFHIEKTLVGGVIFILFLFLVGISPIPPFCEHGICGESLENAETLIIIYDDPFDTFMSQIKEKTNEQAIITSWWDYGHLFKSMARRRVTVDGSTQGTSPTYWVGRLLTTDNTREARGILQLLDCGSGNSYDLLFDETDSYQAFLILENIVKMNKAEAKTYLQQLAIKGTIKEEIIPVLLEKTKCDFSDAYIFVTDDLAIKSIAWAHYGLWNFHKAKWYSLLDDVEAFNAFGQDQLNLSKHETHEIFVDLQTMTDEKELKQWLSQLPLSEEIVCRKIDTKLSCTFKQGGGTIPFGIDLTTKEFFYPKGYSSLFSSLTWTDGTQIYEKTFPEAKLPVAAIITDQEEDNKQTVLMIDTPLQKSMYVRLNYFKEVPLPHFSLVANNTNWRYGDISLWKVDLPKDEE